MSMPGDSVSFKHIYEQHTRSIVIFFFARIILEAEQTYRQIEQNVEMVCLDSHHWACRWKLFSVHFECLINVDRNDCKRNDRSRKAKTFLRPIGILYDS